MLIVHNFNPRSPHGERQKKASGRFAQCDFNPRSPHGERPRARYKERLKAGISTHAPRTGSDFIRVGINSKKFSISTHAPRTGSDIEGSEYEYMKSKFQPTLPARGATLHERNTISPDLHFNPRSPHGERPELDVECKRQAQISTHAPRTGSDKLLHNASSFTQDFNPRSPHGERREVGGEDVTVHDNFNPRSPHGERRASARTRYRASYFNPRSPHGERRAGRKSPATPSWHFNPRSPHGERPPTTTTPCAGRYFNPRSPHGERLEYCQNDVIGLLISTHAPRTGSDGEYQFEHTWLGLFQPTLPARGATGDPRGTYS